MEDNRPSWDEYFKQLTQLTATRSTCKKLHVGCIITIDNHIIAQGYNGYLPGAPHEQHISDGHEIATVHAEQNAICDCAKRGVSCQDSTAYITHYPCIICTRLLLASGIDEIKYIENYKNDSLVEHFCKQKNINVRKI